MENAGHTNHSEATPERAESAGLAPTLARPIRVLVAEDSVVMRSILRSALTGKHDGLDASFPAIELCGMAADGVQCLEAVRDLDPDVLLLDIEMPRLGGMAVLDELRTIAPHLPVILCSSSTESGANSTLDALARGAADYVTKPAQQMRVADTIAALAKDLLPRIAALRSRALKDRTRRRGDAALVPHHSRPPEARSGTEETLRLPSASPPTVGAIRAPDSRRSSLHLSRPSISRMQPDEALLDGAEAGTSPVRIVVIGVSTGGPTALEAVLPYLQSKFPVPVVVVQHMPEVFTRVLTNRLRERCSLDVREAEHGAELKPGAIWIAKGGWHVEVCPLNGQSHCAIPADKQSRCPQAGLQLRQTEPVNGCRPAADRLFRSAAEVFGPGVLALVMTGMGADGLEGARAVRRSGGTVLAQDEATSAIWGMPRRVAEAGLAARLLPLASIAAELNWRASAPINAPNPGAPQEATHGMLND